MKMRSTNKARRGYRQAARAQSAARTGRKIIDAFVNLTRDHWYDEVTLNEIAGRAGVSVQSVIRRYGGKDGLISAVMDEMGARVGAQRAAPPGDVKGAITRLCAVYEEHGEGVMRNLAQETRYADLRRIVEFGRAEHRRLTRETYAPWLDELSLSERTKALDALIVATDIYTWKLFRRDMGRSRADTRAAMTRLVNAVLIEYARRPISEAKP
jgi:AcrR family transcriptional regulator